MFIEWIWVENTGSVYKRIPRSMLKWRSKFVGIGNHRNECTYFFKLQGWLKRPWDVWWTLYEKD
jgi:hypothetical protein